jgi:hypothetical protein
MLAKTEAVDVWYLFPLRDVTRQLALRRSGIGAKEPRLDRVIPRWRDLYSLPAPAEAWQQKGLFGDEQEPDEERNGSQKQIEAWFKKELEAIFGYASEPLPILIGETRQALPRPRIGPLVHSFLNERHSRCFHQRVVGRYGRQASKS